MQWLWLGGVPNFFFRCCLRYWFPLLLGGHAPGPLSGPLECRCCHGIAGGELLGGLTANRHARKDWRTHHGHTTFNGTTHHRRNKCKDNKRQKTMARGPLFFHVLLNRRGKRFEKLPLHTLPSIFCGFIYKSFPERRLNPGASLHTVGQTFRAPISTHEPEEPRKTTGAGPSLWGDLFSTVFSGPSWVGGVSWSGNVVLSQRTGRRFGAPARPTQDQLTDEQSRPPPRLAFSRGVLL